MSRLRAALAGAVDWPVVVPALLLTGLGLLFIRSAMLEDAPDLWLRQALFAGAGALAAACVCRVGLLRLAGVTWEIYGLLVLVLLVLPFVADPTSTGSARWIDLPFGFKLQPSEFMKLALVLALARHLQHAGVTNTWKSYVVPFALTAAPWFLVMRQPDLGSSLVLLPIFVAMVWTSGARLRHMLLVTAAAGVLMPLAYLLPGVLEPYQKERIDAFLTSIPALVEQRKELRDQRRLEEAAELAQRISELKHGTSYQQYYSVLAVGSGGLTGAGLGQGLQNRGNRLPVRHADFIYAVVAEEWGLVGAGTVVLLFAALTTAVLGVAFRTREPFGRLLCVGVAAMVGGQAVFNLCIAVGLLPVTGLPLPLVSYGGSSVLSVFLALGCVLDVARRKVDVFFEQ